MSASAGSNTCGSGRLLAVEKLHGWLPSLLPAQYWIATSSWAFVNWRFATFAVHV